MLISWSWLNDYVQLDVPVEEFERRLMMAGLNHEGTERHGDEVIVNLEVTSNRPDCLGHVGVAREAAVLFDRPLTLPAAIVPESTTKVAELAKVRVDSAAMCPRYTARVIRGVKVGPSPAWLANRLTALGVATVNNIVDVTNYVLLGTGQPLHAFDLAKLAGGEIIVREAKAGEKLEAINHKTYELAPGMCVIADRDRPVALAGVMGGASTEVSTSTKDILIEVAEFDPSSIRATARKLGLHSDSSYRFERGVDSAGLDFASRRCCELILKVAGGELAAGLLDIGRPPVPRTSIVLRHAQIKRVLGIEVPAEAVRKILLALGCVELSKPATPSPGGSAIEVIPPSWRLDLSREIDLIEEVARVYGYDKIPEDVMVPMAASARRDEDRVLEKLRGVLTAAGFDEAMTASVVDEQLSKAFSPWTTAEPLVSQTPLLRGATHLRQSLVPSLLAARRTNEALANPVIELFEIARSYWPRPGQLPVEELMLALTSGGDFLAVKGVVEALVRAVVPRETLTVRDATFELLQSGRTCELFLGDERLAVLGEVAAAGLKSCELRGKTTVAELRLAPLVARAQLTPRYHELSPYPAIERDINLVVDEAVRWSAVADVVRSTGGSLLEQLQYRDTYRDADKLGPGKKSLLFSITLRSADETLTNAEADSLRDRVVAACAEQYQAQLRA